jgi:signal transduction histidine kinase
MGSAVPHTDTPANLPVGEAAAAAQAAEAGRRFRWFVRLDLAAAVTGVLVLVGVLLVVRTPLAWPLLVATVVCVGLLAWSLRLFRSGRVDPAVLAVCATFWLELVIAPLVVPALFGGIAVLTVFPVLFAVPYVQRRTLLVITVATAVASVVAVLLAARAVVPVVSGLPTLLVQVLVVVLSVTFLGLGLTILYAYSGRLSEVVDGLRHANAELQRSEHSLEQKVVERTAEVERAREETARARDEAVGLSHELAAVLDNLGEGLLVIDPDGLVERVNRRLEEMLARPSGSLLHQSAAEVLPELDGIGTTMVATREIPLAEGRLGRAVASGILDPGGGASRGTVVLVRDITVEREVDRMKTDFISTVSHELRTPLTSILGFTKIIAKRLDERVYPALTDPDASTSRVMAQVRGNLDIIVTEGERLTALINDLLDLAKMEAGRVEWRDEDVDVDAVVRQVGATVEPLFQEKDLPLRLDLAPALPHVRGDRHRLEQVVINLLSNACKFTPAGSVTMGTRQDSGAVVVSVTDTGPGIAEADLGDLFVRFKQVGDTLTGKPQGTGLGLPICQEIVEHHGGHIDVRTEVGRGTTFSVTLPLPIANSGSPDPLPTEPSAASPLVASRTLLRGLRDTLGARPDGGPPHLLAVDGHERVPVDSADLLADVDALLAQRAAHRRVLVADSDPVMLDELHRALAEQGWAVVPVSDPTTVPDLVRREVPDVVIAPADPTDPSRLVDALRADPATRHVVVVTFE